MLSCKVHEERVEAVLDVPDISLAATLVEFPATAGGAPVSQLLVDVNEVEEVARLKKGAFTVWLLVNSHALQSLSAGSGERPSYLLRWHRVHARS